MDSENSYVVVIGGTTVSVFILFFIGLIFWGLEALLDICEPLLIGLMVIEILVAVIFVIYVFTSCYYFSLGRKIFTLIIAIITTGVAVFTTYMLKESLTMYACRNPSIEDIISFAIALLIEGGISFFCIGGCFISLFSMLDDTSETIVFSLAITSIPFALLLWNWS